MFRMLLKSYVSGDAICPWVELPFEI